MKLDCQKNMDNYLERLYLNWENPNLRDTLFGELPINNPNGIGGFTTLCPPIPWMGNITTAEYALISLEPLIDLQNFHQQIFATETYID